MTARLLTPSTIAMVVGTACFMAFAGNATGPVANKVAGFVAMRLSTAEVRDARAGANPPDGYRDGDVVLVGDSRIELFRAPEYLGPGYVVRGVSGDTLAGVAGRIGPILASPVANVVVQVGINDLIGGRSWSDIDADVVRLTAVLCAADRPVRLLAVAGVNREMFYARLAWRHANVGAPPSPADVKRLNAALERGVEGCAEVEYRDPWGPMLGENGEPRPAFMSDGLHFAVPGIGLLAEAARKTEGDR